MALYIFFLPGIYKTPSNMAIFIHFVKQNFKKKIMI